jgi:hypothetical protein
MLAEAAQRLQLFFIVGRAHVDLPPLQTSVRRSHCSDEAHLPHIVGGAYLAAGVLKGGHQQRAGKNSQEGRGATRQRNSSGF